MRRMQRKNLSWKVNYDLGIEDIDYQHHYFLNLINRLSEELSEVTAPARQAALIAELNAYARFHFVSEENIMAKAGYPQLEDHRELHLDLIRQLNSREALLKLENSNQRADEIIGFLSDWFLNHTTGEDRRFADFYHSQSRD